MDELRSYPIKSFDRSSIELRLLKQSVFGCDQDAKAAIVNQLGSQVSHFCGLAKRRGD